MSTATIRTVLSDVDHDFSSLDLRWHTMTLSADWLVRAIRDEILNISVPIFLVIAELSITISTHQLHQIPRQSPTSSLSVVVRYAVPAGAQCVRVEEQVFGLPGQS